MDLHVYINEYYVELKVSDHPSGTIYRLDFIKGIVKSIEKSMSSSGKVDKTSISGSTIYRSEDSVLIVGDTYIRYGPENTESLRLHEVESSVCLDDLYKFYESTFKCVNVLFR